MSQLNVFLPGWTTLPTTIPQERLTQIPPVGDSENWSADAANEIAEPRYADYCDRKYDRAEEQRRVPVGWSVV